MQAIYIKMEEGPFLCSNCVDQLEYTTLPSELLGQKRSHST
jgi:hypothetical protein